MDIEYRHIEPELLKQNQEILNQLVDLSKEWALEMCSPSYEENNADYYIDKEVFIAVSDHKIIAYALGELKVLDEETSYNQIGEIAFELDELFVTKTYRNKQVGRNLFNYLESTVGSRVDLIGIIATSYRYEDLLNFYVNDLGLNFRYALLVKRT